jgi:hypothetical protein
MLIRQLVSKISTDHLPDVHIDQVGDVCCAKIIRSLLLRIPEYHSRKRLMELPTEARQRALPGAVQDRLGERNTLLAKFRHEIQENHMDLGGYGLAAE